MKTKIDICFTADYRHGKRVTHSKVAKQGVIEMPQRGGSRNSVDEVKKSTKKGEYFHE